MPKRIFVCSPLRAPTSEGYARNLQIARELTRAVLLAGHAPYTPHLWYSTHLDDTREDQRKMGMTAGAAWLRVADEIWVYAIDESECSTGMKAEVLAASGFQIPVRVVWMPECFAEVRARHAADRATIITPTTEPEPLPYPNVPPGFENVRISGVGVILEKAQAAQGAFVAALEEVDVSDPEDT